MKKLLLPFFLFFLLTSCNTEWEGYVEYTAEGNIADVTIDSHGEIITTTLPWESERKYVSVVSDDDAHFVYISVKNNTTDTSPITVSIYVDGELRAQETGSGAYCTVETSYTITNME
ncbi:MAG: hypothetical protein ACRCUT_10145 [Spirochaetota bacterium]